MLANSFTTFTEPGIGIAAVELLEMAGWEVELVGNRCCGRAAISKGRLDEAGTLARAMTTQLVGPGAPGRRRSSASNRPASSRWSRSTSACSPGSEDARVVAAQVRLADELILEAIDAGRLQLDPRSAVANHRILFHGHCHQKALAGTAASVQLLSRIPGATVVDVDAGCCGMAGSFGFEAEHYELSMQIGGMRLFPAVNAEPADTLVAATGVSCRQQIAHGTGRRPRHPLELIRAAVEA